MVKAIKSQNFTGLHRREDQRESVQDGGQSMSKREYTWRSVSIRTRSTVLWRHAIYHVDNCATLDDRLSNSVCVIALSRKTRGGCWWVLGFTNHACHAYKNKTADTERRSRVRHSANFVVTDTHIEEYGLNSTQPKKKKRVWVFFFFFNY